MTYNHLHESLTQEIDRLMTQFSHTKKDIGCGYRWTFDNEMWFDVIDYKKKDIQILRVGRGARLVKQHPILEGYFDTVSKVIAKMELSSVSILEERGVVGLFRLLDEAPIGIGAM